MDKYLLREKKYNKIANIVGIIYLVLCVALLLYFFNKNIIYNLTQVIVAIILLFIPWIFNKFSKIKITSDFRLVYLLFCFITVIVGSAINGYSKFPIWDKVVHFLSGILVTYVGFIVYHLISKTKRELQTSDMKLVVLFVYLFNTTVASLWEIYEYGLYIFLGIDALNMHSTLANDTMQDMIVCNIGGILILIYTVKRLRSHKSSFLINTYLHFLGYNGYLAA